MSKDYSKYTDYQLSIGALNRNSMVLSADIVSSLVNDCYIVSSLEDPNLSNADVLVPGDTAIVSGYVVAGDNSLSTRTAYTWDGQQWQPQTGKTSAGDVHFNSNFKVDSIWRQPIDGVLSNDGTFLAEGKPLDQTISGAISAIAANVSRVTIGNDPTPADLSVHKVTNAQFFDLVLASAILSNDLYVIEDTYVDAYGQEIKNVLSSTEHTNAATVGQVDAAAFELCMHANQICTDLSNEVDHKIKDLSTALCSEISTETSARISADDALSTALCIELSTETSARISADDALSTALCIELSTETSARISADDALSTILVDKRDKTDLSVYERREGTDRWDVIDRTGTTTALPLTSTSGISTTYSNGNIYGCYKLVTYDYRQTGGNDFLVVVFHNTGITSIQWAKVNVSPERSTEEITETEATAQGLRFVHVRAEEGIFPTDDTLAKSSQLDAKFDKSGGELTGDIVLKWQDASYRESEIVWPDTPDANKKLRVYGGWEGPDTGMSLFLQGGTNNNASATIIPRTQGGNLAFAASPAISGDIAALDSQGNPVDSGMAMDDINGTNVRIGQDAVAKQNSIVIGHEASDRAGDNAVVVGYKAVLGNEGKGGGNNCVVIGNSAQVNSEAQNQKAPSDCMAIGKNAKVYLDGSQFGAVQIGEGENREAKSLKFRDTVVVGGDGKIPSANLDVEVAKKSEVPGLSVDSTPANVNIVHISQKDYEQLVFDGDALSNTLYVVSSDYINAYGQQIKNIAPGNDLSDAVNVEQLNAIGSKTQCLNAISSNNVLSNFYSTVAASGVNVMTIETMCSALFELVKTLGY